MAQSVFAKFRCYLFHHRTVFLWSHDVSTFSIMIQWHLKFYLDIRCFIRGRKVIKAFTGTNLNFYFHFFAVQIRNVSVSLIPAEIPSCFTICFLTNTRVVIQFHPNSYLWVYIEELAQKCFECLFSTAKCRWASIWQGNERLGYLAQRILFSNNWQQK